MLIMSSQYCETSDMCCDNVWQCFDWLLLSQSKAAIGRHKPMLQTHLTSEQLSQLISILEPELVVQRKLGQ